MKQRVVLLEVTSNQKKISLLFDILKNHFEKKEHIILFVADDKSMKYVDELLWKIPEQSFLPHSCHNDKTDDFIIITKKRDNLSGAKFAFNLSPTPLLQKEFLVIYDFDDKTAPHKKMLSQKKFQAYKESKWVIESR
jgi:DNA polymerase IIIc chi subunit